MSSTGLGRVTTYHFDVSEKYPVCDDNIPDDSRQVEEFDLAEVNCNVTYRGNWKPVFSCQPQAEMTEVGLKTSHTATYRNTINMTRDFHKKSFLCGLNYTDGSKSAPVAVADGYRFQWRSHPFNVTCRFSN
jgi:hypothetical protein